MDPAGGPEKSYLQKYVTVVSVDVKIHLKVLLYYMHHAKNVFLRHNTLNILRAKVYLNKNLVYF